MYKKIISFIKNIASVFTKALLLKTIIVSYNIKIIIQNMIIKSN